MNWTVVVTTEALFNLKGAIVIQRYYDGCFMRCKVIGLAFTHHTCTFNTTGDSAVSVS